MCVRLVVLIWRKMRDTFFQEEKCETLSERENCKGYHLSGLPVERKTAQSPTAIVSSSLLIFWWYSFRACNVSNTMKTINEECGSNFI